MVAPLRSLVFVQSICIANKISSLVDILVLDITVCATLELCLKFNINQPSKSETHKTTKLNKQINTQTNMKITNARPMIHNSNSNATSS